MRQVNRQLVGGGEAVEVNLVALEAKDKLAKYDERALIAKVNEVVSAYEQMMKQVRSDLRRVVGGREVLVLDAAMGYPSLTMMDRLSMVREAGYHGTRSLIIERLFNGMVPGCMRSFFRSYYGEGLSLQHRDIRDLHRKPVGDHAAVILSGSPANLSLRADTSRVSEFDNVMSHADVFRIVSRVHARAVDLGVPVVGVCYGAHMLAHQHGGRVEPMSQRRLGMKGVESVDDFTADLWGVELQQGESYVAHTEGIFDFGPSSRPLAFSAGDADVDRVNQLSVHIDENSGEFSGTDSVRDAELLRDVMSSGRYAGFGIQGHHELAFPHLLLGYINEGRPLEDFDKIVERCRFTRDSLRLVVAFLNLHRNFH